VGKLADMARKLRLEFPGAIYHVINRGNYRGFVFRSLGARQAFEGCLLEACERSGWLLHAFVIMGNHYHLTVEKGLKRRTEKGSCCSTLPSLGSSRGNYGV
jgi:REP element-mobilizing transposase RayT